METDLQNPTKTESTRLLPRIYLNSFPKSGTNLAVPFIIPFTMRNDDLWVGSFKLNSWSTHWSPDEEIYPYLFNQKPGTWMYGHMGYKEQIEQAFLQMGTSMVFVYRDLRDVAISTAYHIENPDHENYPHPGRDLFMALPTHEQRLMAVISGMGVYAGLFERWELYASWLECDWVHPVRFEDMLTDPENVSKGILEYVIRNTAEMAGFNDVDLPKEIDVSQFVEKTLRIAERTRPTFRKGKIGEWQHEFSTTVTKVFKTADRNNWLVKLGYEESMDSW